MNLKNTTFHPRRIARYLQDLFELKSQLRKAQTINQIVQVVQDSKRFSADQVEEEISRLLVLLQEREPEVICEIGSKRGGTLIMFMKLASPNARAFAIDINYSNLQLTSMRWLVKPGQVLTLFKGDSQRRETVKQVNNWLNGQMIDFLFIDGDHSYEGVRADFENYSQMVRSGGIIALHDIIDDYQSRHGIKTSSYTGDVPRFWKEIRQQYAFEEIVNDSEQDGFGIGVIFK